MKRRMSFLYLATIIAPFIFLPTVFGQQVYCPQSGIPLLPNQGVTFSQVTYSFKNVLGNGPSGTGQVDVSVPDLIAITGQSSGFINIVTPAGWVTQNLPILPGYPYEDVSTTFDLGTSDGIAVSQITALLCYTPDALMESPGGPITAIFSVGSVGFNAQGQGPNLDAAPPPPKARSVVFPGGLFSVALQPNHQNVQAADNQCGPAAVANNFTWLKTTYGTPIPDMNVLGLRGNPANSLVGQLDLTMGRTARTRADGDILKVLPQLQGLMQYLKNNNILNLTLKHQGTSPFGDGFTGGANVAFATLTSTGQGKIVSPQFIFNEVLGNSAVEYGDMRHVMDVVGAGSILGAPFILYVSDHLQTACSVKPCPPNKFINDDKGTEYVDFSFLCQAGRGQNDACIPDPAKQPVAVYGSQDGAAAVNVFTQRP
ncbi:MAG: hypothetical protein WBM04_06970 [Candidatus Korobacteraceae bacterium]